MVDTIKTEAEKGRPILTKYMGSETCWYCEWDPECQQELSLHPGCSPSTCRIGDISQVFKPKVATIAARLCSTKGGKAVDMLQPVVKSCKGITVEVKCYAHPGKTCKLRPSELHVGGSPCTDLSTLGDGAGLEGTTCVDTLAWLGSSLVLEHTTFVSENVFSDDLLKLIQDTVGHLYVLEFVQDNANPLKQAVPGGQAQAQNNASFHVFVGKNAEMSEAMCNELDSVFDC